MCLLHVQSMPAENSFGFAEASTTARIVGSSEILPKTWPNSVQNLKNCFSRGSAQSGKNVRFVERVHWVAVHRNA